MAAASSSTVKVDFTDFNCTLSEVKLEEFPACVQPTVQRIRWLQHHKDSLQILFQEVLGQGTEGTVYKGCYKNEDDVAIPCAVKFFKLENTAIEETKMLWKLAGVAGMVRLHAFFKNSIVLDYLGKFTIDRTFVPRTEIGELTRQLFQFIKEIQTPAPNRANGIIHGDLTPKNLFWTNKKLTVIDLTLSGEINHLSIPVIQKSGYRAPEIFLNQASEINGGSEAVRYDGKVDVWSAAATVYELITGCALIFSYASERGTYGQLEIAMLVDILGMPPDSYLKKMVATDKYFTVVNEKYKLKNEQILLLKRKPLAQFDLIQKCLRWNPEERLNPEQALQILDPVCLDSISAKRPGALESSWKVPDLTTVPLSIT